MLRSDSPRQLACAALLVLQVVVVAAFTPLEFARRDATPAGAHVEGAGGDRCPRPHNQTRCQVCQVVTLRVAPPVSGLPIIGWVAVTRVVQPQPRLLESRTAVRLGRPRAPPPLLA